MSEKHSQAYEFFGRDRDGNIEIDSSPCSSDGYKSTLIKHSATLLTKRMSEFEDDYPKRFPKYILREIQTHNERLRKIAIDISRIARDL